jgi:hypothetical protein
LKICYFVAVGCFSGCLCRLGFGFVTQGAGNLAIAETLNKEASTKVAKLINDFFMI